VRAKAGEKVTARHAGLGLVRSKKARKRWHGRYLLNAAREDRKAIKRRDGSAGAASPVRHIYNRDVAAVDKPTAMSDEHDCRELLDRIAQFVIRREKFG